MPSKTLNVLSLVIVASFFFVVTAPAQFFSLPSGQGFVESVSNNGVAAGSFNSPEYFMWEIGVGGKVSIGGVPAGNGVGGQASISNDGAFIGGVTFNTASGFHECSRYEVATGMWTPLGGLTGSSGSAISSAWNMSGDGESIVGLAWINAGMAHATHWRDGKVIDLGSTSSGNSSRANAVNYDGTVIGGWQDGNGRQGAVWIDGLQELVFKTNGSPAEEVFDITDDGRFAVGLDIGPFTGSGNPYRYDIDNDIFLELGPLPAGGGRNTAATSITADGLIVGGGFWPFGAPATFGTGFIWEDEIGSLSVNDFFASKGVKGIPAGFTFNFVSAISSNGEWYVGWGGFGVAASQSWAVRIPQFLLGDVNLDGAVDLLDVAPFVDLLANGGFLPEADINQDGVVDLLDVAPFVDLLAG